jgi:adenosylhomocysteine nucleosidase
MDGMLALGFNAPQDQIGRMPVFQIPALRLSVAQGGLGKTEFGVRAQHLIDAGPDWDLVICAGAAGGMAPQLAVGDVVIGTETVEHDINNRMGPRRVPRFSADADAVDRFKQLDASGLSFSLWFGPIASGDEDVVDEIRRGEVEALTGGLAVAWEGAGGARACHFSGVPFVELRGISDNADVEAATHFRENVPVVMRNLAALLAAFCQT